MMMSPEGPLIESGRHVDLVFSGGLAVKTALDSSDLDTAMHVADRLTMYSMLLAEEPIEVAPVRNIDVVRSGDAYTVRHTMDIIPGPSILRLPLADRQQAITKVIHGICNMSTLRPAKFDPDTLKVPIDGSSKNWHMNGKAATLVDVYPPLARELGGSLPLIEHPDTQWYWEKRYGTKSGAIAGLLYSSFNIGNQSISPRDRLRHLFQPVYEWCYDTLPTDASPIVRRRVERQIRLHFAPLITQTLVRVAQCKSLGLK